MYLVTGANGPLGRAVISHLLSTHALAPDQIIAVSRDATRIADLAARGIQTRSGSFDDPAGLAAAFAGARRMLMISTDNMAPGERQKQHLNAIAAAEAAGVAHVIYTSLPKPDSSSILFAPDHLTTERALAASSLPGWTVLRHNWYAENLFMSLPQALAAGVQYTAAGQGTIPYITRDDLARADAAVLASDRSGKATHTLTGTRGYTTEEIAQLLSAATGTPLRVVHLSVEALVEGMIASGLPVPVAQLLGSMDRNTAEGGLAEVTGDVERLTGTPPRTLEDWLHANAAAFAG